MIETISVVWKSSSVGSTFAPVDVMLESDLAATRALRVSREPRVHACTALAPRGRVAAAGVATAAAAAAARGR